MPKRMALNVDQMTPFARMIFDYLMAPKPTLLVRDLAILSGINDQTIWDWLRKGTLPRRQTIVQLAERVPDIAPLDDLLRAAGLPTTEEMQRERAAEIGIPYSSIRALLELADSSPAFSEEARAAIHHYVGIQPEKFVQRTDTWREWNHGSPAQYEAQRAAAEAQVYEPEPITTPEQMHGLEPPPSAAPPHTRRHMPRRRDTGGEPSGPYRRVTGS